VLVLFRVLSLPCGRRLLGGFTRRVRQCVLVLGHWLLMVTAAFWHSSLSSLVMQSCLSLLVLLRHVLRLVLERRLVSGRSLQLVARLVYEGREGRVQVFVLPVQVLGVGFVDSVVLPVDVEGGVRMGLVILRGVVFLVLRLVLVGCKVLREVGVGWEGRLVREGMVLLGLSLVLDLAFHVTGLLVLPELV